MELTWKAFENPGGNIPKAAINWAVSRGMGAACLGEQLKWAAVPEFVKTQTEVAMKFQTGAIKSSVELPKH